MAELVFIVGSEHQKMKDFQEAEKELKALGYNAYSPHRDFGANKERIVSMYMKARLLYPLYGFHKYSDCDDYIDFAHKLNKTLLSRELK